LDLQVKKQTNNNSISLSDDFYINIRVLENNVYKFIPEKLAIAIEK